MLRRVFRAILLSIILPFPVLCAPAPCPEEVRILLHAPHPDLDRHTMPGFSDSLRRHLEAPLRELGYCLRPIDGEHPPFDTLSISGRLVLRPMVIGRRGAGTDVHLEETARTTPASLIVALFTVRDWLLGNTAEAISRPLASLPLRLDDPAGMVDVIARKAAEGMRKQYVAHVVIRSRPDGADVSTGGGLRGATPVEWILPLGQASFTLQRPGYLPLRREIDLNSPGLHAYDLQLTRRRFYHSRFFYPAVAFGLASAGAYAAEMYFYDRYQSYGPVEQQNRPGIFGQTFRKAKTWERAAAVSLLLAGASLGLSFRF